MNAPTYICLQKNNIKPITFNQWLSVESHIYIGSNLARYTRNPDAEDEWGHLDLERQLFRGDIGFDEYCALYEHYIRQWKWDKLDELADKVLGCWCTNPKRCHFSIIKQLFYEKQLMKKKNDI